MSYIDMILDAKIERLGELREKDRDGLLCEDEWEEYDALKDELRNYEG